MSVAIVRPRGEGGGALAGVCVEAAHGMARAAAPGRVWWVAGGGACGVCCVIVCVPAASRETERCIDREPQRLSKEGGGKVGERSRRGGEERGAACTHAWSPQ